MRRPFRRSLLAFGVLAVSLLGVGAAGEAPEWLTGVNLSGGELNPTGKRLNHDYVYSTPREIQIFTAKGFRVFRLPVLSSRLLAGDAGPTVTVDWAAVVRLIGVAADRNAFVILDFHQYGAMPQGLVGRDAGATEAFARAWGEIARRLKDQPCVVFGLMNEPNKQTPAEWRSAVETAIAAIRKAGARQLILVPGSAWDGAYSWVSSGNAGALEGLKDPADNLAFEVHQYLDADNSGSHPAVVPGSGATRLAAFTTWARAHNVKGFLGEFGFAATPEALAEGEAMLSFIDQNRDVWRGWTYWAAGPWWGDYMFSVEPGRDGADKPQMAVLERHK